MCRAATPYWLVPVVLVIAVLGPATEPAQAGIYDTATAWWQLDFAASGAVGAAADIRDQRTWGAAGAYAATSLTGSPTWTTAVPAQGPGGGQTYGGRGLSLSGADAFNVSNLAIAGDATVVVRYKWDGTFAPTAGTLYDNGFNWGSDLGWLLRLTGANGVPEFYYGNGAQTATTAWTTDTTRWYDLALVVNENGASDTITFYRWAEGGAFESQAFTRTIAAAVDAGVGTRVGTETVNFNGFHGTIENVAVWNRALSVAEIHDAFGSPNPRWSIGLNNSSLDDLRHEGEVDAAYTIGEPWNQMRRALTASADQAVISFNLTADQKNLPYVFHLDVGGTDGGQNSDLSVLVNGSSLGLKTLGPNAQGLWYVPASMLQVGANTLTIRRNAGPAAYIGFDSMEFAGSWQVGFDNNTQAEFSSEGAAPDDFYVTDPNWLHLERAMTAGDPDINIHFNLSRELIDEFHFVYTTEVIGQSPTSGNSFDVRLNGTLLRSYPAMTDNTVLSLALPRSLLAAGDNMITLHYTAAGGWTQFDYHRLEVLVPEPSSMALLAGGGLLGAVALVRRRRASRAGR